MFSIISCAPHRVGCNLLNVLSPILTSRHRCVRRRSLRPCGRQLPSTRCLPTSRAPTWAPYLRLRLRLILGYFTTLAG
eukprot:133327-Prorocentrum_minimum.AAC.2